MGQQRKTDIARGWLPRQPCSSFRKTGSRTLFSNSETVMLSFDVLSEPSLKSQSNYGFFFEEETPGSQRAIFSYADLMEMLRTTFGSTRIIPTVVMMIMTTVMVDDIHVYIYIMVECMSATLRKS